MTRKYVDKKVRYVSPAAEDLRVWHNIAVDPVDFCSGDIVRHHSYGIAQLQFEELEVGFQAVLVDPKTGYFLHRLNSLGEVHHADPRDIVKAVYEEDD